MKKKEIMMISIVLGFLTVLTTYNTWQLSRARIASELNLNTLFDMQLEVRLNTASLLKDRDMLTSTLKELKSSGDYYWNERSCEGLKALGGFDLAEYGCD